MEAWRHIHDLILLSTWALPFPFCTRATATYRHKVGPPRRLWHKAQDQAKQHDTGSKEENQKDTPRLVERSGVISTATYQSFAIPAETAPTPIPAPQL